MILQKQPFPWACLVTSFAMVIDLPVRELIQMIGHDGSEVFWSGLPEPLNRRSHHIQEVIYALDEIGYHVTPFEGRLVSESQGQHREIHGYADRVVHKMTGSRGVLTGIVSIARVPQGALHAVAWNGYECLDPGGFGIKSTVDFWCDCFWRVTESNREAEEK